MTGIAASLARPGWVVKQSRLNYAIRQVQARSSVMQPLLSRTEQDAYWERLIGAFPRVPSELAFDDGSAAGPAMKHGTSVLSCLYSLHGASIIAAGGGRIPGCDTAIRVFDSETGDETLVCRGHIFGIYELAIDPHTGFVASASEDYSVILWNLERRDAIFLVGEHPIVKGHVSFCKGRRWLAVGEIEAYEDFQNAAYIIDLDTGDEVFRHDLREKKEIGGLAMPPGGAKLVATINNHQGSPQGTELVCWNVLDGKVEWSRSMSDRNLRQLFFLPNEERIVASAWVDGFAAGYATGAYLLDARSGSTLAERILPGIGSCFAVSPDGETIAVCYGEGGLELLRTSDLEVVKTLRPNMEEPRTHFCSLAFSPDGTTLIAGTAFHVPDVGTQGEVLRFTTPQR
jgi:WD40 repeat protein